MKPDFFYECEGCKGKIPATFAEPNPEGMQTVVVMKGKGSETTFRCEKCRKPEPDSFGVA